MTLAPTRTRMISAMTTLLQEQGYNASGVSEILEASHAPKGSLYHHFPGGKVQLAAAAVDESRQRIMHTLQTLKNSGRDPVRTIETFVNLYIRQMQTSDFAHGCPVATVTLETAASVDLLQTGARQFFDELAGFITTILSERGLEHATAATQAVIIISIIEGALILSRAQRSTQPLVTARDFITTQLRGLFEPV